MGEFLMWLVAFLVVGLFTGAQVLRAQGLGGGGSQSSGSSCLVFIIGSLLTIGLFLMMIYTGMANGIIGN